MLISERMRSFSVPLALPHQRLVVSQDAISKNLAAACNDAIMETYIIIRVRW